MDFSNLDLLKQQLDQYRPLPEAVIRNLRDDLVLRWTYHSNAIEGNTLTLKETKVALEGITVGGKTLREHLEVINHRDTICFVEALVSKPEILSQWQIKSIHQLILKNIDDNNAGRYRTVNVTIAGAQHVPPDFIQLPQQQMANFIHEYQVQASTRHPVERAARLHCDLVKIHPFVDGNGRTARLLMNLELMKSGFPAAILPLERRLVYYETLDKAHTEGDYIPFFALVSEIVALSFKPYWHALGIQS
jgi:Fic family protein